MKKESIIQISIGAALFLLTAIIAPLLLPGGRFDPWLSVILGAIVVSLIFPLLIRWAIETKEKHKAVSIVLIVFLVFWTLAWLIASILTLLLAFK